MAFIRAFIMRSPGMMMDVFLGCLAIRHPGECIQFGYGYSNAVLKRLSHIGIYFLILNPYNPHYITSMQVVPVTVTALMEDVQAVY
jgi:hypothetical protein